MEGTYFVKWKDWQSQKKLFFPLKLSPYPFREIRKINSLPSEFHNFLKSFQGQNRCSVTVHLGDIAVMGRNATFHEKLPSNSGVEGITNVTVGGKLYKNFHLDPDG